MPKSQKELDSELLIALYQNLQTAKRAINNVIEKIMDSKLKHELKRQFKDYDGLSESCEDLAKTFDIVLCDNNFFTKVKMWLNVNMATLLDRSNRKIASINILGSTMGTLDLMSILSDRKKCKPEIINLGRTILDLEEKNINKLKPYILVENNKQNNEMQNNETQDSKTQNSETQDNKMQDNQQENTSPAKNEVEINIQTKDNGKLKTTTLNNKGIKRKIKKQE